MYFNSIKLDKLVIQISPINTKCLFGAFNTAKLNQQFCDTYC